MEQLIDVGSAARSLGVGPERVRQLIAQGDLEAQWVGRQWLVQEDAVRRRARIQPRRGRPYASGQVWLLAAMAELDPDKRPDLLQQVDNASVRWRLRRYLSDLLSEDDPAQAAWRLRERADHVIGCYAHPSVLPHLAKDDRLVLSGARAASAHGSDLVADDPVDAYVDPEHLEPVVADHHLLNVDTDANVRLRPSDHVHAWRRLRISRGDAELVAPLLFVAADLSERDDARARDAAKDLWESLRLIADKS